MDYCARQNGDAMLYYPKFTHVTIIYMQEDDFFYLRAKHVSQCASRAIDVLQDKFDSAFVNICKAVIGLQGNVILMAVGKSSFVAGKFSSTLASLGIPAFFVHPAEAGHGDCGNITENDVVIMLSHSGTTEELCKIAPFVSKRAKALYGVVGVKDERLSFYMHEIAVLGKQREACHVGLAPTTSTTVFSVYMDAIAVCVSAYKGLDEKQFAITHPYGHLGKSLTVTLGELMKPLDQCAKVFVNQSIVDSVLAMLEKQVNYAIVFDGLDVVGIHSLDLLKQAFLVHANPALVLVREYVIQADKTVAAATLLHDVNDMLSDDDKVVLVVDQQRIPVGLWVRS